MAVFLSGSAPNRRNALAQIAASKPCKMVIDKVMPAISNTPISDNVRTVARASMAWYGVRIRLSPSTWITTVTTLSGRLQSQSKDQGTRPSIFIAANLLMDSRGRLTNSLEQSQVRRQTTFADTASAVSSIAGDNHSRKMSSISHSKPWRSVQGGRRAGPERQSGQTTGEELRSRTLFFQTRLWQ